MSLRDFTAVRLLDAGTKFATNEGRITDKVEYIEHYPPDTTALFFG